MCACVTGLCVSACKGAGQKEVRQWQHQKTAAKNLKKADLEKERKRKENSPGKKRGK